MYIRFSLQEEKCIHVYLSQLMQSLTKRKLRLCISDIDVFEIARFSSPENKKAERLHKWCIYMLKQETLVY